MTRPLRIGDDHRVADAGHGDGKQFPFSLSLHHGLAGAGYLGADPPEGPSQEDQLNQSGNDGQSRAEVDSLVAESLQSGELPVFLAIQIGDSPTQVVHDPSAGIRSHHGQSRIETLLPPQIDGAVQLVELLADKTGGLDSPLFGDIARGCPRTQTIQILADMGNGRLVGLKVLVIPGQQEACAGRSLRP